MNTEGPVQLNPMLGKRTIQPPQDGPQIAKLLTHGL